MTIGEPAAKGQKPANPTSMGPAGRLYYTLWSVERVAVAYDLKTIGNKDWYAFGSDVLLATQKIDGSWAADFPGGVDTCFALLFLRKANLAADLTTVLKGRVHDPDHAELKAGPGKTDSEDKPKPKEESKPKPEIKPVETVKEKPEVPKPTPPAPSSPALLSAYSCPTTTPKSQTAHPTNRPTTTSAAGKSPERCCT